jgi:cyanophycinase
MKTGALMAIGGGEEKKGDIPILEEFVHLCGGAKANIVVIVAASQDQHESGPEYVSIFHSLKAKANFIVVNNREDASLKNSLKLIEDANAVFFPGGDQLLITTRLGGSQMEKLLHERHKQGMIIGGTSAGAAMMANSMIMRGETNAMAKFGNVELGPGLDFLPGVIIDTHFSERGRFGRLLLAVAHYPHDLGLGIDRNTAMVYKDNEFYAMGEGVVTVIDAGDHTYSNLADITRGGSLSIFNVKVHFISQFNRFNIKERLPYGPKARRST